MKNVIHSQSKLLKKVMNANENKVTVRIDKVKQPIIRSTNACCTHRKHPCLSFATSHAQCFKNNTESKDDAKDGINIVRSQKHFHAVKNQKEDSQGSHQSSLNHKWLLAHEFGVFIPKGNIVRHALLIVNLT